MRKSDIFAIFIALTIQNIISSFTNLSLLFIAKLAINPKQDVNELIVISEFFIFFAFLFFIQFPIKFFKKILIELHIPNRKNLFRFESKSEILDKAPNVVLSTLLSSEYLCKFCSKCFKQLDTLPLVFGTRQIFHIQEHANH